MSGAARPRAVVGIGRARVLGHVGRRSTAGSCRAALRAQLRLVRLQQLRNAALLSLVRHSSFVRVRRGSVLQPVSLAAGRCRPRRAPHRAVPTGGRLPHRMPLCGGFSTSRPPGGAEDEAAEAVRSARALASAAAGGREFALWEPLRLATQARRDAQRVLHWLGSRATRAHPLTANLRMRARAAASRRWGPPTNQVVAGTNIRALVRVAADGECVHVSLFRPLPHTREPVQARRRRSRRRRRHCQSNSQPSGSHLTRVRAPCVRRRSW